MLENEFRKAKKRSVTVAGKTILLYDEIPVSRYCSLTIRFHSAHSEWRQGVRLGDMAAKSSLQLTTGVETAPRLQLWCDTSPDEVKIFVDAPEKKLYIYNIWDKGNNQASSMRRGAGMILDSSDDGAYRTYNCNDGHEEMSFNHLIFSCQLELELTSEELELVWPNRQV